MESNRAQFNPFEFLRFDNISCSQLRCRPKSVAYHVGQVMITLSILIKHQPRSLPAAWPCTLGASAFQSACQRCEEGISKSSLRREVQTKHLPLPRLYFSIQREEKSGRFSSARLPTERIDVKASYFLQCNR